jgi:hypothetical protein
MKDGTGCNSHSAGLLDQGQKIGLSISQRYNSATLPCVLFRLHAGLTEQRAFCLGTFVGIFHRYR